MLAENITMQLNKTWSPMLKNLGVLWLTYQIIAKVCVSVKFMQLQTLI